MALIIVTTIAMIADGVMVVLVCVAMSRARQHDKALDRLREAAADERARLAHQRAMQMQREYADYSQFNQDQLLRNRSERWDA
jgi:hypothetical protein